MYLEKNALIEIGTEAEDQYLTEIGIGAEDQYQLLMLFSGTICSNDCNYKQYLTLPFQRRHVERNPQSFQKHIKKKCSA